MIRWKDHACKDLKRVIQAKSFWGFVFDLDRLFKGH